MTPNSQYEVYVLCSGRSVEIALRFLDAFLPFRRQIASEYSVPELCEDPALIFLSDVELMQYLEKDQDQGYAIYWDRVENGEPHQAMLIFTEDGGMIAGLACAEPDPEDVLRRLAEVVGGCFGLVALEERPPETISLFLEKCRASRGPRMIDGEFYSGRDE